MFTYVQATGKLYRNGILVAAGYSGHGEGKNNPAMQQVPNVGPVPVGIYTIKPLMGTKGNFIDYGTKKAPVFMLEPDGINQMFNRRGFLIHGDSISSPGAGSEWCIIESNDARWAVAWAAVDGDDTLCVVAEDTDRAKVSEGPA